MKFIIKPSLKQVFKRKRVAKSLKLKRTKA
ncbi:hypothetical protein N407_04785 [Helicobacter pylori FD662]|nr:hypothetical protein N407_04785 [Helicobacter pylori FD662]